MSFLLTLHRHPTIGFNSSTLLELADRQTTAQSSFLSTSHVEEWMDTDNAFKLTGCIPIISIGAGIFRLYQAYQFSKIILDGERQIDRDWAVKKEIALAIAEIFQFSVVLLGIHLLATVFDHVVVVIDSCYSEDQPVANEERYMVTIEQKASIEKSPSKSIANELTQSAFIYEDEYRALMEKRARIESNRQACAASLRIVQNAVGGKDAFDRIPILDLKNRKSAMDHIIPPGSIDFIQLDDLTDPVMQGIDAYGRPFIALKLCAEIIHTIDTANDRDEHDEDAEEFQSPLFQSPFSYTSSMNFENPAPFFPSFSEAHISQDTIEFLSIEQNSSELSQISSREIKTFVVTLFQRYPTNFDPADYLNSKEGLWYTDAPWNFAISSVFPAGATTDGVWRAVHQIVVEKNHPTLWLATEDEPLS